MNLVPEKFKIIPTIIKVTMDIHFIKIQYEDKDHFLSQFSQKR